MAYFAPYIDAAGFHMPTYADILADLIAQAKSIYGSDIYLGNDSMDYQYISVFALKVSDTLQAIQLAYNNRGPGSAISSGLDGIVKINGIARKSASHSTCQVVLTGTAGITITNGIVSDISNNKWDLPATVTLDGTGSATVSATCETIGAITALPGNINNIVTPTAGWTSVTNTVAAVAGQPVETDSQLRSRQAISTESPSQALVVGTTAGIASVSGVTRYLPLENDTNATDSNGLPAHSFTAVVEGGTDINVANQIYARKTPGCYTNGTTVVSITDPLYGLVTSIRFYRPTYVPIYTTINIKKLSGYTTATTAAVQAAINTYLNSLQIGESLTISALWGVALSVMPNLAMPIFSITSLIAGTSSGTQGTTDITIAFNQVTQGSLANITVNAT